MKKIIILTIILISLYSCSNTETYYGEDAICRYINLPTPQAFEEGYDYLRTIYVNIFTKTKYEFMTSNKGEMEIDKCVLKVTKNCDVDEELAKCKKINMLFRNKKQEDNDSSHKINAECDSLMKSIFK